MKITNILLWVLVALGAWYAFQTWVKPRLG